MSNAAVTARPLITDNTEALDLAGHMTSLYMVLRNVTCPLAVEAIAWCL